MITIEIVATVIVAVVTLTAGVATAVKFIYRYGQRQQREKDYREKVAADIADLQRRNLNPGDGDKHRDDCRPQLEGCQVGVRATPTGPLCAGGARRCLRVWRGSPPPS